MLKSAYMRARSPRMTIVPSYVMHEACLHVCMFMLVAELAANATLRGALFCVSN
jgi:hypothetical protein